MYIKGGDASERDYLSESRRLVSTHCTWGISEVPPIFQASKDMQQRNILDYKLHWPELITGEGFVDKRQMQNQGKLRSFLTDLEPFLMALTIVLSLVLPLLTPFFNQLVVRESLGALGVRDKSPR